MAAFCEGCGAKLRDATRFCAACGRSVEPDIPTEVTAREEADVPGVPQEIRRALLPELVIQRVLGRGGMGQVLLAQELSLERLVAVKILSLEESDDAASVERFLREARVAANLRHPNITAIHGVGQRGRVTYFTMDHVQGSTLSQLVQQGGPVPDLEACRIMTDVAEALAHAHSKDVIHRDIKPPNIMVQANGHVFVMDFGLARLRGTATLTESGVVHGTPEYMSPEQAEGLPATAASDAYAFGLTLFHLLAGRHLVRGETVASVIAQHVTGDVASLAAADPHVPFRLRAIIRSLLARDPARRPVDLASVAHGLRGAGSAVPALPERMAPSVQAPAADTSAAPPTPRTPSTSSPTRAKARKRLEGLLDKLDKARDDE